MSKKLQEAGEFAHSYLIGQIHGVIKYSLDSDRTKLATIARYIEEYDAEMQRRIQQRELRLQLKRSIAMVRERKRCEEVSQEPEGRGLASPKPQETEKADAPNVSPFLNR